MTGSPTTVDNITFTVHCCSTSAGSIKLSIDTDITIIIPSPTATYNFYFDSPLATESQQCLESLNAPLGSKYQQAGFCSGTSGSCFYQDIPLKKMDPNPAPLYFTMQAFKKRHHSQKNKGDQAEVCVCFSATSAALQHFISLV